jgi:hypothetical protein
VVLLNYVEQIGEEEYQTFQTKRNSICTPFVPIFMYNRECNMHLIRLNEKDSVQRQVISQVIPLENIKFHQ